MRKKIPLLLIIICTFLLQFFAPGMTVKAADEDEHAAKDAQALIHAKAFSRQGLIEQLESMGHPHNAAESAVDTLEADWDEMALKQAASFLSYMTLSGRELTLLLTDAGFTEEEAAFAVENCGADWNAMAVKHAASYTEVISFTSIGLMKQLQHDGFTYEQALHAATETLGAPAQSELDELSNPLRVSDEMRTFLSENLENIFPIQSLKESYASVVQPIYADFGPQAAVQMRTREGQQSIRIYANPDGVHEFVFTDRINAGNLRNFMLSMDVSIDDIFPGGQGGCFIGYVNESISSVKNHDSSLVALAIEPDSISFYSKNELSDAGSITRIMDNGMYVRRLTLIHLTGLTFAYVDGEFAGQFYDGNEGPFQLVFGSALYKDGDSAACSFDNMAVRKVN